MVQSVVVSSQTIDLYKFFTGEISKVGLVHNLVKMKAAILNFYKEFIKYYHTNQMVPTLIEMLITDYSTSSPDLRFHQIIDCITALIETIGPDSQSFIDPIFNGVVIPTFEMISSSFDNYPEIRLSHFLLLSSLMTKGLFTFLSLIVHSESLMSPFKVPLFLIVANSKTPDSLITIKLLLITNIF